MGPPKGNPRRESNERSQKTMDGAGGGWTVILSGPLPGDLGDPAIYPTRLASYQGTASAVPKWLPDFQGFSPRPGAVPGAEARSYGEFLRHG